MLEGDVANKHFVSKTVKAEIAKTEAVKTELKKPSLKQVKPASFLE